MGFEFNCDSGTKSSETNINLDAISKKKENDNIKILFELESGYSQYLVDATKGAAEVFEANDKKLTDWDIRPIEDEGRRRFKTADGKTFDLALGKKNTQGKFEFKTNAVTMELLQAESEILIHERSDNGRSISYSLSMRNVTLVTMTDTEYNRMFDATIKAFNIIAENHKNPPTKELFDNREIRVIRPLPQQHENKPKSEAGNKGKDEARLNEIEHERRINALRTESKDADAQANRIKAEKGKEKHLEEKLTSRRVDQRNKDNAERSKISHSQIIQD